MKILTASVLILTLGISLPARSQSGSEDRSTFEKSTEERTAQVVRYLEEMPGFSDPKDAGKILDTLYKIATYDASTIREAIARLCEKKNDLAIDPYLKVYILCRFYFNVPTKSDRAGPPSGLMFGGNENIYNPAYPINEVDGEIVLLFDGFYMYSGSPPDCLATFDFFMNKYPLRNAKRKDAVMGLLNTLSSIRSDDGKTREEIFKAIDAKCETLTKPNDLVRAALACRALAFEGNAGDVPSADFYDHASWKCVERLASMATKESEAALDTIFLRGNFYDGALMRFSMAAGRDVMKLQDMAGFASYAQRKKIRPSFPPAPDMPIGKFEGILWQLKSAPLWCEMKPEEIEKEGERLLAAFRPMLNMPYSDVWAILFDYLDGNEKPGKWGNVYVFNRLYFKVPAEPVKDIGLWMTADTELTSLWPLREKDGKFELVGVPTAMRPGYSYSPLREFEDFRYKYGTRHPDAAEGRGTFDKQEYRGTFVVPPPAKGCKVVLYGPLPPEMIMELPDEEGKKRRAYLQDNFDAKPYLKVNGVQFPEDGYALYFRQAGILVVSTTDDAHDVIEALTCF